MADPVNVPTIVALPTRDTSAHGKRYTPADRETAYARWRALRSQRKVAEAMTIALSTIGQWAAEDGWAERAKREDREDAEAGRERARAIVLPIADELLENLKAIARDPDQATMGRVKATELLLGYVGLVVPKERDPAWAPEAPTGGDGGSPVSVAVLASLTPEEFAEYRRTRQLPARLRGEEPPPTG